MIGLETLRGYPVFAALSDTDLQRIAAGSQRRVYLAGDFLFQENQPAHHLFIIEDGEVDILCECYGGETRAVDTARTGEFLCWSGIVCPHRCTATGMARADTTALAIEAPVLRELCAKSAELGRSVLARVADVIRHRLNESRRRLAEAV